MAKKFYQRFTNFLKRNLIKENEGKLTYVQIFGFVLITLGVIYFASFLLPSGVINFLPTFKLDDDPTPNAVSLAFFTTMLGVAFAFPDLLKGQTKDISTMRIIVFMFANVICMLLLKIGWSKDSLSDIGLDGYWMGVIAFLFGAKATQSYFENTKSILPNLTSVFNTSDTPLSKVEVSRLAANQNRDELIAKHPNIECISDTIKNGNSTVTIYVKDNKIETIPKEISATLKNGSVIKVPTEIISDSGEVTPHFGLGTYEISDSKSPDYFGSICCLVSSLTKPDFKGIVTAGHVFTHGYFYNYGGLLGQNQKRFVLINGNPYSQLYFQQMKFNQDIAIVELTDKTKFNDHHMSFEKGFYQVTEYDFNSNSYNVTIASRKNNIRDAYILDFNVSFEIKYINTSVFVRNIILIGSTNDRATSKPVSIGGDSGSCVYHKDSGKLIGLLLGGNKKFSFVLPIQETLNSFDFKLL